MLQADGGGSGPAQVTLRVAPEDLYDQARDYDHMANMAETAVNANSRGLRVEAPGADVVSVEAARRLNESAFHPETGLIPQMTAMVVSFRATAEQLRATATSYGLVDDYVATTIDLTGKP